MRQPTLLAPVPPRDCAPRNSGNGGVAAWRRLLCGGLWWCGAVALAAAEFPVSAENGALRLTVESVRSAATYSGSAAPEGRQWFVAGCRWRNRIDAKLAAERGAATAMAVGDLAKHLYLVVDGARLGTLRPGGGERGRRALGEVVLTSPGSALIGDLVFEIPAGGWTGAELRFYDDIAGHFVLVLGESAGPGEPPGAVVRNEVGEFGLFRVDDPVEAPAGAAVPDGCRVVSVELRARSIWKTRGPAPEYDFAAPAGAEVERTNLLDWPGTSQSFVLLADGEYASSPLGGTLPEVARFLPDVFTGGTLLFAVPRSARTLELVGTLGHAATEAGAVDFAPVRLAVSGGRPQPAAWAMPLRLSDEMFRVAVGARRERRFAGEPADEGQEFLVLDVGVENTGAGGEYFQPAEQLQLIGDDATSVACDEATWRSARRPQGALYVPAGERRRFELAFRVAAGAAPKLVFRGGSCETQHELPAPTP